MGAALALRMEIIIENALLAEVSALSKEGRAVIGETRPEVPTEVPTRHRS